ncbi:hypothetical protein [Fictibacillus fluitans]|uniref:Uncharacterized protein n=1 Tax=Fictibacillus fluitans TaxID=3058422 RepID=A0ABT8I0J6_9BACL|nr:hypothetical protein [Fictibacillus sp. NE201]MDN4526489.1 hypothetical protein [Fictibacillus sp. NE201]
MSLRRRAGKARKPVNVINFGAAGKRDSNARNRVAPQNQISNVSRKLPLSIDVNWIVDASDSFIPTSWDIAALTGITAYRLISNPFDSIYAYRLEFINTKNYDYYFRDASGDVYEVNTFRNGTHYVEYNSSAPNIIHIYGS